MRFHRNAKLVLATASGGSMRENPDRRERRSRETVGFDARH